MAMRKVTPGVTKAIGANLRLARKARGWTLRSVAVAVGVTEIYWCVVESGRKAPSLALLIAAATVLGVSIDSIVTSTAE